MSALSLPWRDVEPGMTVVLKGRPFKVKAIDAGKKRTSVTIDAGGLPITREVKSKDEVEIQRKSKTDVTTEIFERTLGKLEQKVGERGVAQGRWAEEGEALAPSGLKPGDPSKTEPPEKLTKKTGSPWDPKGETEKILADVLGAKLVGATYDEESGGWRVPPVGPDTIYAHLFVFHDLMPNSGDWEEWHKIHEDAHERAAAAPFAPLHVNHWHTKRRPTP